MSETNIQEVVESFTREPATPIPGSRVREWLTSDDPEILGALCHFLTKPAHARVQPGLTFMECQDIMFRYGTLCLHREDMGEWADSRYTFGTLLVGWIVGLWGGAARDRRFVRAWKEWLARQYADGDAAIRRCIVDATLEHLVEHREIRNHFADWKADAVLGVAYEEADAWRRHGGRSPLVPDAARD